MDVIYCFWDRSLVSFPAFSTVIIGVFSEKIIAKIEQVEYPDRVRTKSPKVLPDIWHDFKFAFKVIALNLLILPFYLLLGSGLIISIILNAYLLSCEFFEIAAGYHLGKLQARLLRKQNRGVIFGNGVIIALLALVPLAKLLLPVTALVWMLHLYHKLSPKTIPLN